MMNAMLVWCLHGQHTDRGLKARYNQHSPQPSAVIKVTSACYMRQTSREELHNGGFHGSLRFYIKRQLGSSHACATSM